MSNYFIGVDYDGKPYLEHLGSGKKHKYIMKITTPGGSTRYFYTEEEVDAYKKKTSIKDKVTKKAKYAVGLTQREYAVEANNKFKEAKKSKDLEEYKTGKHSKETSDNYDKARKHYKNVIESYYRTPLGKIESTKRGEKLIQKHLKDSPYEMSKYRFSFSD